MVQIVQRIVAAARNRMALRTCPEQEHHWISDRMSDRWRLRCLECGGTTDGVVVAAGNLDRQRPAVIERQPMTKQAYEWRVRQFDSKLARRARMAS